MFDGKRRTWAEIHLDRLAFNFQSIKSKLGEDIKYMAVVKANAYGHGAVGCARKLEQVGVDWFAVALPEEGSELRKHHIRKPILCLGSFQEKQEEMVLENDLTPVIFDLQTASRLNELARRRNIRAKVHIKVDTGMNRVGVRFDELQEFVQGLKKLKNLEIEGVMTHFAVADSDMEFTMLQVKRFDDAVRLFHREGFNPVYRHLANSPGALGYDKSFLGNMVRLGGVLYGLRSDVLPSGIEIPELKQVMTLHTEVRFIKTVPKGETIGYGRTFTTTRDSVIASLPIGYNDGYRRCFSNKAKVIVRGCYANVVGRISMDWTLIDVTDVVGVEIGDEVMLIGESNGLEVTAETLASICDTISYEITCGISSRVPRIFKE
ncbi:MAG: alanine racemase [Acidobacteria bacterium]|jgi:alanine racemase|nr:MAG: alanine racemase [Acidobacteriota bacterium]GIU81160.1 MAG: alanine racemase [Pyrinomonadaceae bacterium]